MAVAILYSGSVPAQAAIADHVGQGLSGPSYSVWPIDIAASGDVVNEPEVSIAVAVGPGALDVARQRFDSAEIVFSQVLEPAPGVDVTSGIRGVAPMPPLTLQFGAWAEVDGELERIGLITSEKFAKTIPGANNAAAAIGAELEHRISTSDRETLYIFRRLAPTIDGLWLAPDSEILSPPVIEEMLAYAARFDVSVLVFSESLLERGGLISIGAPAEHVAAKVIEAVEHIRSGRAGGLPTEIPLNEAEVRVNTKVAAELGLAAITPAEWVVRGQ